MKISKTKVLIAQKYDISYEDIIYVDLYLHGWTRSEAAFYAYQLTYEDTDRIMYYIRNHEEQYPGISRYEKDCKKSIEEQSAKRSVIKESVTKKAKKDNEKIIEEEVSKRLAERLAEDIDKEVEKRLLQRNSEIDENYVDIGDKNKMREELIRAYNSVMDPKLRLDYAKQLISLDQMQKEQTKEEDTRIFFHTSTNCKYCDRCVECVLKDRLIEMGEEVVKINQSPCIYGLKQENNEDEN